MVQRAQVSIFPWTVFEEGPQVLEQCLAPLGGIGAFVKPGQTVVVKPNITADAPSSSGGTTHMELTEAVVEAVLACDPAKVYVAEATGRFGTDHETAFPRGGWREMAARQGVELFNLDHGPHRDIQVDGGHYPHEIPFSELVLECDVFITIPCLKTHLAADYTVALKNSFALTPQRKRSEIHRQFMVEASLADINRIRKPDLTVVDGWDGAEGIAGGTDFKRPAGARMMIVGGDPVAVDTVSVDIMQSPQPTRYLRWCAQDGVGVGDLDAITIHGPGLEAMRHPFMTAAEEILLDFGDVRLYDMGADSGDRVPTTSALMRFMRQKQRKPIGLVYGGVGELETDGRDLLIIGDAAVARWGDLGTVVPGNPPTTPDVMKALREGGVFSQESLLLAKKVLAEIPEALKAWMRVVADGEQVHVGENVKRGEWHLQLLVGDGMGRYAEAVMERAASFGIDVEHDFAFVKGSPPTEAAVQEAVAKLGRSLTARQDRAAASPAD